MDRRGKPKGEKENRRTSRRFSGLVSEGRFDLFGVKGRDAGWGLVATHLMDLNAFVAETRVEIFHEKACNVLGGGVQLFVKRREFVKVAVIQVRDDLVSRRL